MRKLKPVLYNTIIFVMDLKSQPAVTILNGVISPLEKIRTEHAFPQK
jgi:hypothetical protein